MTAAFVIGWGLVSCCMAAWSLSCQAKKLTNQDKTKVVSVATRQHSR
jgi:hypothetical protein